MLDIKLKNSHKINKSKWIIVLVLLFAAAGTLLCYKWMGERAEEYYTDPVQDGEILDILYKGAYMLYQEAVERESAQEADRAEFFIPEEINMNEEVSENVKAEFSSVISNWKEKFDNVRNEVDYCTIYGENRKIEKNTDAVLEGLLKGDLEELKQRYQFYVVLEFDADGNMEILRSFGSKPDNVIKMLQALERSHTIFESFDEETESTVYFKMNPPRNFTIIYAVEDLSSFEGYSNSNRYDIIRAYSAAKADAIFYIMLAIIAIAVMKVPFSRYAGKYKRIFQNIPAEVWFFAVMYILSYVTEFMVMMGKTNSDQYVESLIEVGLLPNAAAVLVYCWNGACLFLFYGISFVVMLEIKEMLAVGIWNYVKQKSIIYRFFPFTKNLAIRFYKKFTEIDLTEKSNKVILRIVVLNFILLTIFCSLWFFGIGGLIVYSFVLFYLLRKYYSEITEKYQKLLEATSRIAKGNLEDHIIEDLGIFEPFREELLKIQSGFKKAVDEEVKSQRMKTELITNVSHDLKTPLTAIITYVNLLKEESVSEEERKLYIDTLEKKSLRLKALIEDLFEISKASSKNITLNIMDVDILNLMKQVKLEFSDKIEASNLDFRFQIPEEKIILPLDSQKTYRIFENLYGNIIKYAMPNTRVYIEANKTDEEVQIVLKNISAAELDFRPEEITDRFVRGDSSRNTEGSGLGLAIAKSFVELQKGKLLIELDGDLFKVILTWQNVKE